jgi:hypothetical protein
MVDKRLVLMAACVGGAAVLLWGTTVRQMEPGTTHGSKERGDAAASKPLPSAQRSLAGPHRTKTVRIGDHPINISDLFERTHFAFQDRLGALRGGDTTYAVAVSGSKISLRSNTADSNVQSAALELQTVSVGRDGANATPQASGSFEAAEDGHLVAQLDGDTSEHLKNTPRGLETILRSRAMEPTSTSCGKTIEMAILTSMALREV